MGPLDALKILACRLLMLEHNTNFIAIGLDAFPVPIFLGEYLCIASKNLCSA